MLVMPPLVDVVIFASKGIFGIPGSPGIKTTGSPGVYPIPGVPISTPTPVQVLQDNHGYFWNF